MHAVVEMGQATNDQEQQKVVEVVVVRTADAIAHKRAVMVEPRHAIPADAAVLGPQRLADLRYRMNVCDGIAYTSDSAGMGIRDEQELQIWR